MVNIRPSVPWGEKKGGRENIAVSVEGEISLTMYTSAISTVLDCCTNKWRLGESKRFVK